MALPFYNWSQTAANNATADSTVNWAEGQAPSTYNDSARAMMASTAAFRDDIAGAIVTGGTSTAYTVSSFQVFDTLAHLNGKMIAFTPNATSTNGAGVDVTLNVDGLGAKPIRQQPNTALPTGTLVLGSAYIAVYNNSDGAFYLLNSVNKYSVPLAAGMDYWGSATPNSNFAFPAGQAISRTTYATLFNVIGTTYGAGDGSTTFNLPDKTGRVTAMIEASPTRLTSTYFGGNSTVLGATGGVEKETLLTANLPPYTPAGSVSTSITSITVKNSNYNVTGGGSAPLADTTGSNANSTNIAIAASASSSFTGSAQGGSSTPVAIVQPTIVCNYIIRII